GGRQARARPIRARAPPPTGHLHQLRAVRAGRGTPGQDPPARPRVLLYAPLLATRRGVLRCRGRDSRPRRRRRGLPRGLAAGGGRDGRAAVEQTLRARRKPPGGDPDPNHVLRPTLTPPSTRRRRRRASFDPRLHRRWGLRVIHIMYTVWGDHTTSSGIGQEFRWPVPAVARGCRLSGQPRGAGGDLACGGAVRRRGPRRPTLGARGAGAPAGAGGLRDALHEAPRRGPVRGDV